MKTKITFLAMLPLAAMTLAGCGQNQPSGGNTPATTNAADAQPMPGAAASNNAVTPPAANGGNANSMATTNSPGTNNPPATNP